MDDIDADQQHVMGLLEPHLARMYPIFGAALDLYNGEVSAKARADHDTRAICSAVYCHAWKAFEREFIDEPGFNFLNARGLNVLNIRDEVVLRVKKVDENGRHQNATTAQQRAFDAQMDLPDIPPAGIRIVMGYQPDEAFSMVERVIVRRPLKRWVSQITEVGEACQWVDITPVELPFAPRRAAKK
jgi:hypothetical protein